MWVKFSSCFLLKKQYFTQGFDQTFLTPTPCSMQPGEFKRQAAIRPRSITPATAQALSP